MGKPAKNVLTPRNFMNFFFGEGDFGPTIVVSVITLILFIIYGRKIGQCKCGNESDDD